MYIHGEKKKKKKKSARQLESICLIKFALPVCEQLAPNLARQQLIMLSALVSDQQVHSAIHGVQILSREEIKVGEKASRCGSTSPEEEKYTETLDFNKDIDAA